MIIYWIATSVIFNSRGAHSIHCSVCESFSSLISPYMGTNEEDEVKTRGGGPLCSHCRLPVAIFLFSIFFIVGSHHYCFTSSYYKSIISR